MSKTAKFYPAFNNRDWLRSTAEFRRLGEMAKTIRNLEKRIEQIEIEKEKSDANKTKADE